MFASVERLRYKLSPLEDKTFTETVMPLVCDVNLTPYIRKYKGKVCVVISPRDMWALLFPGKDHTLHNLTVLSRTLQALLWERSYLLGDLVFTKTLEEIYEDGF
jgi:hypothetical protein